MNIDHVYSNSKIKEIPRVHLSDVITDEILELMLDCGQKVTKDDPELRYMVDKLVNSLRTIYCEWRLKYVDSCFRNGKMDRYDKGQKITVKRLEVWLDMHQRTMNIDKREHRPDVEYTEIDLQRFRANAERYPNIIFYRQQNKPYLDDMELSEIEVLPDFKKWLQKGADRKINIQSRLFQKV